MPNDPLNKRPDDFVPTSPQESSGQMPDSTADAIPTADLVSGDDSGVPIVDAVLVHPHGDDASRPPSESSAADLATTEAAVSAAAPAKDTSLVSMLTYGLTLPERTVRSTSAIVGGLVNETAGRLIPGAFRSSKSYEMFVQQALDMMIHDIGGVENTNAAATEEEAALAQRAVGGLLDIAGTATLHLSPLTVLAVFNDVAYGSGYYLRKLSEELKREGVIDETSSIDHVSDLVEALHATSSSATDAVNAPPVSVDGLTKTISKLTEEIGKIDPRKVLPQPEVTRLWKEMEETATQENVGLWDVGATMTMFAMNRLSLTSKGALTTVHVAGDMLDEHILQHYVAGLSEIQEKGIYQTLAAASAPYLDAVWHNFDGQRETWTEELVSGRLFDTAWSSVRGWISGGDKEKNV